MKTQLAVDAHGAPVLLVADTVEWALSEPDPAEGSDHRRRDAVADAARTLDDLSSAGVGKLARQRWRGDRAITPEDVDSFSRDARAQRVHDVVDALDHRIRRAVNGRAGSKQMHVSIPRGIARKSIAALDGEEMKTVFSRLRDRGWSDAQIKRHGIRRLDSEDRRLQGILGGK